jgi:hypothetical protein
MSIIQNFVTNIGAKPWWAITKGYSNVGALTFKKAISDNYSQGKDLTLQSIWNIVSNAISSGQLPGDSNGVYLVLSSRKEFFNNFIQ